MLESLLDLVLPRRCLACGRPASPRMAALGLCPPCRGQLLAAPHETSCAGCGRPLAAAAPPPGMRCGLCRRHPPAYDRLLAGWLYRPPLDTVIGALKFRRLEYLAPALGRELGERRGAELEGLDGVVPLPLHWTRRWLRGFDQAEAIGSGLAATIRLPLLPALRRVRATPRQMRLARQARLRNPVGAFLAVQPLRGARLALIDDVATTGATLSAAARALRRAGAREVVAAVVARTPRGERSPTATSRVG